MQNKKLEKDLEEFKKIITALVDTEIAQIKKGNFMSLENTIDHLKSIGRSVLETKQIDSNTKDDLFVHFIRQGTRFYGAMMDGADIPTRLSCIMMTDYLVKCKNQIEATKDEEI